MLTLRADDGMVRHWDRVLLEQLSVQKDPGTADVLTSLPLALSHHRGAALLPTPATLNHGLWRQIAAGPSSLEE